MGQVWTHSKLPSTPSDLVCNDNKLPLTAQRRPEVHFSATQISKDETVNKKLEEEDSGNRTQRHKTKMGSTPLPS